METRHWAAILSRIIPQDTDDLDSVLSEHDPRRRTPGGTLFPHVAAQLQPQTELSREDAVCVGLRAERELDDAADRAMRLAAFATEHDVQIVVLSHVDRCGLERYGFRTERITGDSAEARAACEQQILRFWNIDLVL